MSSPRSIPLIALVLAVCVLVVQARVVLGGKTWDDVRYHAEIAPPRHAAADAIMAGELPTWWEGSGLGVPLLGEPSHGAAYPPVWLATGPRALDLVLIFHMLWLALGIALWGRRLGASELSCVLAGVLVAASGIVASAAMRGVLPALAHVPWVAWAALGIARAGEDPRARLRATLVLGLSLGAIGLAGELAILVDALALAVVVGLRAKSLRALAIGIGAGVAIAAVQWVPALLVIADGAGTEIHPLRLSRLLELVLPASFGSASPDRAVTQVAGEYPGWPSLFVGAPILALALLSRGSTRLATRMVGLVVALLVLAGIAGRGGWPAWLGAPELHVAMLALLAAAHGTAGLDALIAGERRAVLAVGGAALASALALGALAALGTKIDGTVLQRALIDGGLGIVCIAGAIAVAWRMRARDDAAPDSNEDARPSIAALVTAALVVAPSVGALGSTAPVIDRAVVAAAPSWVDAARTVPNTGEPRRMFRPLSLFEDTSPSSVSDAVATMTGTVAARHGIGAARSEDPARPAIHDRVWLAASSVGGSLLERYGIPLAILPANLVEGLKLAELARRNNWALARFPTSPPAAIISEWIWLEDDAAAIARLFPPGVGHGLPAGLVVLHGRGTDHQDEPAEPEPCTISRWSRGAIDMTCVAHADAYAVVSSTSADGWTVHVAGRDTPWVTADVMRRAVAITAGPQVVSWRYVPPGLLIGALLGALGVVLLAGYAVFVMRRRRRHTRDQESRETN